MRPKNLPLLGRYNFPVAVSPERLSELQISGMGRHHLRSCLCPCFVAFGSCTLRPSSGVDLGNLPNWNYSFRGEGIDFRSPCHVWRYLVFFYLVLHGYHSLSFHSTRVIPLVKTSIYCTMTFSISSCDSRWQSSFSLTLIKTNSPITRLLSCRILLKLSVLRLMIYLARWWRFPLFWLYSPWPFLFCCCWSLAIACIWYLFLYLLSSFSRSSIAFLNRYDQAH